MGLEAERHLMSVRWTEGDLARLRAYYSNVRTHYCEDYSTEKRRTPIAQRRLRKLPGPIDLLVMRLEDHGIVPPTRELVFQQGRKWRFDLAWREHMVAVEIEGGIWVRGRHVRGAGYQKDLAKYNAACLAGWQVLRYSPAMLRGGEALRDLLKVLEKQRPLTPPTQKAQSEKRKPEGEYPYPAF